MKARKKGTNEPFANVESVCLCSGGCILARDVEFEPTPDHWQDLRERAAIAAIQAYCAAPANKYISMTIDDATKLAVKITDSLVDKLKGE